MPTRVRSQVLREIEVELSEPRFFGVPLGAALSNFLYIDLGWGYGDWRRRTEILNMARRVRHYAYPRQNRGRQVHMPPRRILVTWITASPRFNELILPVLAELGDGSYNVVSGDREVAHHVPPGTPHAEWEQIMSYDVRAWRKEYARCRPEWESRLRDICRRYDFPGGVFELLSLTLMVSSQRVLGALEFLERTRPSVILTDFDRHYLWSCLVLAAQRIAIPSVTLVHGAIEQDALGFSPVLADKILPWGRLDRDKLLAAGEPEEKVIVAGCPRLSRDLSATKEQGRDRLNLNQDIPWVMFGSSPGRQSIEVAELFCAAVEDSDEFEGFVRLHPAESPSDYAAVIRRHPSVRFSSNSEASLDESLAAADIVVACRSGTGSDALVKRQPVVVLSPDRVLSGPDWDLVELAGCPHARTSAELKEVILGMLRDDGMREHQALAAEKYVHDLSAFFGRDAARQIAAVVREQAGEACKGGQ